MSHADYLNIRTRHAHKLLGGADTDAVINAARRACQAWAELKQGEGDRTVQLSVWMDHLEAVVQAHDESTAPLVVDVETEEVAHG